MGAERVLLIAALASLSVLALAPHAQAAHGPITITSDAGFADTAHWSGAGTAANPYRPTLSTIVASGGRGIEISGTNAYVNLSGLTITGGAGHSDGIRIFNARNVTVWGSTLETNRWGIYVKDSSNVLLAGNTIKTSALGVNLEGSTQVVLRDNKISLNDANVRFSASRGNLLENNNLSVATGQYGLSFADNASYDNTINATNVVNGIPLRWYTNVVGPATISDVTVDLPRMTNVAQIMVYNGTNVRLERVVAKAGAASGIHVFQGTGIELVRPTAEGNAGSGIVGELTTGLRVSNASARNNTANGVLLQSVTDAGVEGSNATGNNGIGVKTTASSNVVGLRNLTTASNLGGGVSIDSSRNVTVEFSTLASDGVASLSAGSSRDLILRNNTISGSGPTGLGLGSSFAVVSGNTIRDRSPAVSLTTTTGSNFTDNTITLTSGGVGFSFDGPSSYNNAVSTTNLVSGTPVRWYTNVVGPVTIPDLRVEQRGITNVAQIMLYRTTNVTLTGAVAKNGTAAGLVAYESHDANFSAATASSNAAQGVHVHGGSALRLLGSTVVSNSGDGVKLFQTARALLENNVATSNAGRGIAAEQSDAPTLRGNAVTLSGSTGIALHQVGPGAGVADNNVVQSNAAGILATSSTMGSIRANTVAHNGADGISLSTVLGSPRVEANNITNHTRNIRLGAATGAQVLANTISMSAGQTGVHFDDEASYNVTMPPTTTVNGVAVRWYNGVNNTVVPPIAVELRGITNVAQIMVVDGARVTFEAPIARNGTDRGIYVHRSHNVTLQEAIAESNTRAGIHAFSSRDLRLERANASRNLVEGAFIHGSPAVWINNSTFERNLGAGLLVESSTGQGGRIENSTFRHDRGGIRFTGSTGALVHNNTLAFNGETGLSIGGSTVDVVSNNTFEDHARHVEISGSQGTTYLGNLVTKLANQTAWHFADEGSYANNVGETNLVNGVAMRWYSKLGSVNLNGVRADLKGLTNVAQVMLYRSGGGTIQDLRALNGTDKGLYLFESGPIVVNGSLAENNTGIGIFSRGSANVTLRNTTLRLNGGHGAHLLDATITLDNLTSERNGGNGALLAASANVRSSLFQRNAQNGLHATLFGALNVSRSTFDNNSKGGLTTDRITSLSLYDNELASNGPVGIFVDGAGGGSRVSGNRVVNHTRGIEMRGTEFIELHGNTITINATGAQTGLHFDDETSYNNVIPTSNTVNGAPVHWYTTLAGTESAPVTLSNVRGELRGMTNIAQVMVYRSAYVSILSVVATNGSSRGLYLYRSSAVTVDDANVSNSSIYGIHLHSSQSSTIRDLRAQGSGIGVQLTDSANNLIQRVNASGATTGVVLGDVGSRDNRVHDIETNGTARGIHDAAWNGQGLTGNNLALDAGAFKRGKIGASVAFPDTMATYRLESDRIVSQTWGFGDGSADVVSTLAAPARPPHAYAAPGWYRANASATTASGVTLTDSVWVEIVPPLSAPRNLLAIPAGRTVQLNWTAPEFDGAAAITKYKIYRGVNATDQPYLAEIPASSLGFLDTNLENGKLYHYAVSAVNADGEGPRATIAATPVSAPGAPATLTATPGPQSATLNWTAPLDAGGLPILGYHVLRATNGSALGVVATLPNVTGFVDTGLTNGQPYTYAVRAYNPVGNGALASNVSVTPVGPPSAPREVRALPGDASATILWSAPADSGGKPITAYRLWRGGPNETLVALPDAILPNASSHRATGLSNGRPYVFAVTAVNEIGEGITSTTVNATPVAVDALVPVIFDRSPAPDALLGESPATIRALYVDNDGIVLEAVRIYVDELLVEADLSASGFSYEPIAPLASGLHSVRVVARDPTGNVANETWSFRVLSEAERVAIIEFSNATLLPARVLPGANVTARVVVTNSGYLPGNVSANVTMFGNVLASAAQEIPPLSTVEIFLEFGAPTVEGNYSLFVAGSNLTLAVSTIELPTDEAPTDEAPPEETPPTSEGPRRPTRSTPSPRPTPPAETPGAGALLALVGLGAAAYALRRRG